MSEPRSRRPPAPVTVVASTPSSGEEPGDADGEVPLMQMATVTPDVSTLAGKEATPCVWLSVYIVLFPCRIIVPILVHSICVAMCCDSTLRCNYFLLIIFDLPSFCDATFHICAEL